MTTTMRKPPDFRAKTADCLAELWVPEPNETGLVVMQELNGSSYENHSLLCGDVRGISRVLSEQSTLTPFFTYVGATLQKTPSGVRLLTKLGLSSPERVNARTQALPVPADHRPPFFMRFNGAGFKAEDQQDALLDYDSFLVATGKDLFVHDWMHMLGGLLLLKPEHVELVKQRFRTANPSVRKQITNILLEIDKASQWHRTTIQAIAALALEDKRARGEPIWHDQPVEEADITEQWAHATEGLHQLLFGRPGTEAELTKLGQDLREHCHILGRAALLATQTGVRT
jgi:hypothetical protein